MLEIKENFNISDYKNIAEYANCKDLHITEAVNGNSVYGFIAYSYSKSEVIIYDFNDNDDLYLCDGLVRSVLFKGCLNNLDTAVFKITDEHKLSKLRSLNFVQINNNQLNNINDFMDSCKKCKEIH